MATQAWTKVEEISGPYAIVEVHHNAEYGYSARAFSVKSEECFDGETFKTLAAAKKWAKGMAH